VEAREIRGLEEAYADDLLAKLRRPRRRLAIDRAELVGTYPDTALVVIFRAPDRPCLFGVRDRIWEEETPEEFNPESSATSAFLRWEEALDTGELPHRCDPDSSGTTWLDLWTDWS